MGGILYWDDFAEKSSSVLSSLVTIFLYPVQESKKIVSKSSRVAREIIIRCLELLSVKRFVIYIMLNIR